jgi:hypothetical protein
MLLVRSCAEKRGVKRRPVFQNATDDTVGDDGSWMHMMPDKLG